MLVSGFAKAASQSSVEDNNPATSGRGEALSAYSADARIGIRIGKVPNFQVNGAQLFWSSPTIQSRSNKML